MKENLGTGPLPFGVVARPHCQICQYYDHNRGECHKRSPGIAVSGFRVWPQVDADDWCGDFLPSQRARDEYNARVGG